MLGTSPSASPVGGGNGISIEVYDGELRISGSRNPTSLQFLQVLKDRIAKLCPDNAAKQQMEMEVMEITHLEDGRNRKHEAAAYYHFYRLLSDERYAPGQMASDFCRDFIARYSESSPTVADQKPVKEVVDFAEKVCRAVESSAGAGQNSEANKHEELMPWLRPSVSRCLFSRVGGLIWKLYEDRHSAEDCAYVQKQKALKSVTPAKLLENLEVRQVFCCESPQDLDGLVVGDRAMSSSQPSTADTPSVLKNQWDISKTGDTAGRFHPLPYDRAVGALSNIGTALKSASRISPREAVCLLSAAQVEMKTCVLEASHGAMELEAMDDVMPVFVYVLARSDLSCPFAAAAYMNDALDYDERLDSEGRAVMLLESAARYIAYDWDIEKLTESPQGIWAESCI
jgi:hypothetical protein